MKKNLVPISLVAVLLLWTVPAFGQKVSALSNVSSLASNALFSVVSGGTTRSIAYGQMTAPFALKDEVSVDTYGAVAHVPVNMVAGSYITNRYSLADNTAAIQAAFNAAYASNGRSNTVFFPKGIWMIGSNVYVPPGINVRGVGMLHAGDWASSILRLETNAYSVIWQTNLNRGGLCFSNLNSKGSVISHIEIAGHTNPLAYAQAAAGGTATDPSVNLANGPGLFLGAPQVTDWDTTAAAGVGSSYAGDCQMHNVTVSGFKVGVRSSANSCNFNRLHMVTCDVGFQTTDNCCGGDQTVFNNCSASCRSDGIGYDFRNNGAARGVVYLSPSDYQLGTWIRGTNCVISVQGGNMEFTATTTRTNFIEAWGSSFLLTMNGTRVQGNGSLTSFINYGEDNYGGMGGGMYGCKLQDFPSFGAARNAAIPTNYPCLLRTSTYDSGAFQVYGGGTEGWRVIVNTWPGRAVLDTYPMGSRALFAPFEAQTTYWGAFAWDNMNLLDTYGRPWIIRGSTARDIMEIWLADNATTGPLSHSRIMQGDASTSTAAVAPNTMTLDGLKITSSGDLTATNGVTAKKLTVAPLDAYVVNADNYNVPTSSSLIYLTSDNATATSRTFRLAAPTREGQLAFIIWGNSNAGELVDNAANSDSGVIYLNGTWTPLQEWTLTLIGTSGNWFELARGTTR